MKRKTLLRIDSSPLSNDLSFTRQLTSQFVQNWLAANPEGRVIARDLGTAQPAPVNAEWIGASYTPEANRTDDQRQLLKASDELIAEMEAADEYVLGVPMHNFGVPSVLKLWIDQVARAGKTFAYTSAGPAGLLQGKKATFMIATGGVYNEGPAAAMNFVEPYLKSVFGFIGLKDTQVINASGTGMTKDRGTILNPAFESIRTQLQAA